MTYQKNNIRTLTIPYCKITVIFLFLIISGLTTNSTVRAERLENQIVVWSDFSNVHHLASSMNYVYAATSGGILKYDKLAQQYEEPLTGGIGLMGYDILGIWVDTFDKYLYVETEFGLFEYDPFFDSWTLKLEPETIETDTRHVNIPPDLFAPFGYNKIGEATIVDRHARNFPISDVIDDGSGTLWIGTWGHGLGMADAATNMMELLPYGLLQNSVGAILDEDTLVWLGGPTNFSFRTGLTTFDPSNNSFDYLESGLDNDFPAADVYCLEGDSLALYIGSSLGLFVFDREIGAVTDHLERRTGLLEDEVTALQKIGDTLMVGSTGGISVLGFANDTITYLHPGEFLGQLIYDFELVDSTLWIAAQNGAYRFSLKTNELFRFQDPQMVIFSRAYAIERYENDLWFVGDDGLLRLDLLTGETKAFKGNDLRLNRSSYLFRALAVNDKIAAVASGEGFTLFFMERSKPHSRQFGIADGLPSATVLSLKLDGDYLWVGTDRGLCSFWWNNPNRID